MWLAVVGLMLIGWLFRPFGGKLKADVVNCSVILYCLHCRCRHLWQWWCGGISISDLLIIICWLALQAAWMAAIMGRYQKLVPFFERLTDNPTWLLECQLVAVALGSLLFPNFVLLFYPVTRGSVVLQASGISYPDAIR
eukprot:GHRR01027400.1.p2 GENE.GHRR01027400.1~~GHRR01027400.1.p2  ORF type:complete len:139 (+),score=27.38 GHRR01027400.1:168-584(+)